MKTPPLWLRNGIPSHLIEILRSFYRNFTCSVGDGNILFEVKTGVRQGCVMSTVLFNLVVDWIMRRTTEDQNSGIRCTPLSYLEDLAHADDLALLSHTQSRLNKARNSLNMMSKAWRSSTYSTHTKLRLSWRLTEKELIKLSTFHTKSLRRILRIFWPKTISNKDLLERCGTESMTTILMRRRWRWISHVIRQEASIVKTALHWRPEGSEGGVFRRSRGGGW